MVYNSHIPAYATCFARKVCSPVQSSWGASLREDKLGARAMILNTKVARPATIPPECLSNRVLPHCEVTLCMVDANPLDKNGHMCCWYMQEQKSGVVREQFAKRHKER